MTKIIDVGLTERDLFEAILAESEAPDFDPAIHLDPDEAARRWRMDVKSAIGKLRKDTRLQELEVYFPDTKRRGIVFVPRKE
jgi:hypothetical protein